MKQQRVDGFAGGLRKTSRLRIMTVERKSMKGNRKEMRQRGNGGQQQCWVLFASKMLFNSVKNGRMIKNGSIAKRFESSESRLGVDWCLMDVEDWRAANKPRNLKKILETLISYTSLIKWHSNAYAPLNQMMSRSAHSSNLRRNLAFGG